MSEQFDASELRVAPAPQTIDFIAGFTRAAPCPSDQLKLFSASAVERHGVAFSLVSFFWRSKRKILAPKGEIFAKRCSRENEEQDDTTKQ